MRVRGPKYYDKVQERDGKWLSFAEVLSLMERYAGGFQRWGVSAECRVCVNVSNSAVSLLASYALCCTGAAVVLAKPSLTEREILYQVQDSGASFILTQKENAEKILELHRTCKFKGLFSIERVDGFQCVVDLEEQDARTFEDPCVSDPRTHIMLYTYTSGTTGLPKGVEISMYAFNASCGIVQVITLCNKPQNRISFHRIGVSYAVCRSKKKRKREEYFLSDMPEECVNLQIATGKTW
ncbi:hypothetical protein MTO96_050782 [Rhipicephalus appendiculatus]